MALVVACGHDIEPDDDLALRVGRELEVVGRAVAAVGHLHHLCLGVGRRGPGVGRGLARPALGGLELGQVLERPADPLRPLGRRPLTSRSDAPRRRRRVVVELGPECRDLGGGLGQEALERRPPTVRGGARRGPHPHPVLGDDGHRDEPVGEERRHALGEERIEAVGLLHAERGEGVVVHPDPAGEPAIGVVLGAQPIERPGRADPLERRVQPERGQDRRIDRRPAGMASDCPDPLLQRTQIEALHEGPHEPRSMVGRQEAVEVDRAKLELAAVRTLQARGPRSELLGLGWLSRREREEGVVHALDRICDDPGWESPGTKDSQPLS